MLNLSAWAVTEKNKTAQTNAWLRLLEITWPQEATPYRVASNTEDVLWNSLTWQANSFSVGEISDVAGEIPQCTIDVQNVDQVMEAYLLGYASYTKTNGVYPVAIKLYTVNSGNLAETDPETLHEFELIDATIDIYWASLTCGVPNKYKKRFPETILAKNYCQYRTFAGPECGYSGVVTSCDRTLATCRTLANSGRFGGFPGTGDDIYRGGAA